MPLDEDAIRTCMGRKRFIPYQGRDDVRCYSHHVVGWVIKADGKFMTEHGRDYPIAELKKLALDFKIEPSQDNLEEIAYIAMLHKPVWRTPEKLKEAHNKILGYLKKEKPCLTESKLELCLL